MGAKEAQAIAGYAPTQRVRSMAQGLTLGFADELEARAVALASGRPYDEVLAEVRDKLEAYQEANPVSSLAYEAGGAMIPTAMALLAAPFTGGSSTAVAAPSWMRLLGVGALEGGAYGFGTGEGGFNQRADRALPGAVLGAPGAVVGGTVANVAMSGLQRLADAGRRIAGRRGSSVVENEIQRLVQQTGKDAEQVIQDLMDGRILAENRTLAAAIKVMQTGPATPVIQKAMKERPRRQRDRAGQVLSETLDDGDPNMEAVRKYRESDAETQKAISREYKQFRRPRVDASVFEDLKKILQRNPQFGEDLNEMQNTLMRKPLFSFDDAGDIKFLRRPTVQEAEEVYKVIRDRGISMEATKPFLATGTKNLGRRLKDKLNKAFPKLADARAQAQAIQINRQAFEAGKKSLGGRDVYETLMELEEKFGSPEALDSFRTGFLAGIQQQLTQARQKGIIRDLIDDSKKQGMLLRNLVPDDDEYNKVIKQLELAAESEDVAQKILNNSITIEGQISKQAQNAGIGATDILGLFSYNPESYFRTVSKLANKFSRELTPDENLRISQILVSEDPDLVKNAIMDDSGMQKLVDWFDANKGRVMGAGRKAGAVVGGSLGTTLADNIGLFEVMEQLR